MEEVKKISSKNRILLVAIAGLIVLLALVFVTFLLPKGTAKQDKTSIITTAALQKIVNESELSTSTAIYNGVAEVYNEKKTDKIDCYVAYNAKVSAGIDFGKIRIEVNETNRIVNITLPEVHITNIDVDVESMDFIFNNEKANTSTFTAKALKACEDDVKKESSEQPAILDLAKQNAVNAVTAWVKPFIEDMDNTYMLVVN